MWWLKESICCICNLALDDGQEISKANCNHLFHKKCLAEFFNKNKEYFFINKCPNCNTKIEED